MGFPDFTFKILMILLPGIIATFIIQNLTLSKNWDKFKFGLYSLLFGFLSYLILDFFYQEKLTIWDASIAPNEQIPKHEILWASIISTFLGILISFIISQRLLYNVFIKLKISKKFGNGNLFYEYLREESRQLIHLEEIEKEIKISGYIKSYSESNKIREIHLNDVKIYHYYTGDLIEELNSLYKCWPIEKEITIEEPIINLKKKKDESKI